MMVAFLKRVLSPLIAGALLWGNLNACWMASADCEVRAKPAAPCHGDPDEDPAGKCCGKAHLAPATLGSDVEVPAPKALSGKYAFPDAALILISDFRCLGNLSSPDPPLTQSPPVGRVPSRSPPLA